MYQEGRGLCKAMNSGRVVCQLLPCYIIYFQISTHVLSVVERDNPSLFSCIAYRIIKLNILEIPYNCKVSLLLWNVLSHSIYVIKMNCCSSTK